MPDLEAARTEGRVRPDARRPVVAIPARFSQNASALRYRAIVASRALAEAVFAAGGEPVLVCPSAPEARVDVETAASRIWFADAVLLPGGGDVSARWSGQDPHPSLYDVDEEQDAFDLALARVALDRGLPLLAICRGVQLVNVALGGDLVQDMATQRADSGGDHRQRVHDIEVDPATPLGEIVGARTTISCYHHQCIARLGEGLRPAAHSADGVIEAVTLDEHGGWYLGIQWHPEDTAATDPTQAAVFRRFVDAAARSATAVA